MYESRSKRNAVEAWVDAQPTCPTRKQTRAQFPDVEQKHVRAALQARQDRERQSVSGA